MIYLLTTWGKDKPGLVEALAHHIEHDGGNWLESRLCRLGGQFAGIVRIEYPASPTILPTTVETLTCHWQLLTQETTEEPTDALQRMSIDILAADRPGIVKQIAHIITSVGANIEEVESRVLSAPFSGEPMFEGHYAISLPDGCDRKLLTSRLEGLAEELMCDLEVDKSRQAHMTTSPT